MGKFEKMLRDYDLHCKWVAKSTQIDIFETPQQKADRIKRLESNYGDWFEYHFKEYATFKCAKFHKKAANILSNPIAFLILEVFRGGAKSVHVCMGIPLWLMVTGRMKFMLLIGLNERKANRLLSDVQAQLKFNQRFIADYGELFKYGDWSEGDFSTTTGIRFASLGLGQDPRGMREGASRPDYIVPDDIDTKKRCNNPTLIQEAVDYIIEDLWGCYGASARRFVLANNRIHKNGVLANLVKIFKALNEKAEQKGQEPHHHHLKVNRVDKNGNPTWPERDTKASIESERAETTTRGWESNQMNNPIQDGKIFKAEDLQYKAVLPLDDYDALCIYGDLSYKDTGDFKALKFWGKKGREYHLIDCFVRQTSRREAAIWLYDLFEDLDNKTNRFNIRVKIEALFAMDEFVNEFDEEGDTRKWWIDVIPDKRGKANKFDRIESTSGKYERRRVFYNIKHRDSADFIEAVDQLLAFEKGSGAPDDSPDADHGAFDLLDRDTFVDAFEPKVTPRKEKSNSY